MRTKLFRAIAIVAASYARRHLEPAYDAIMVQESTTAVLGALSASQTQAVEFALHGSTAVVDAAINEHSPLAVFLKAILSDVGPELARRLATSAPKRSPLGEVIDGEVLQTITHPRKGEQA